MNFEKQKLLVNYIIASEQVLSRVNGILLDSYFDPKLRKAVTFVKSYYDEYKAPPKPDQLNAEIDRVGEFQGHPLTIDEIKYAENEIEKFCKYSAMEAAVFAAPAYIMDGDFGKVESLISEAIAVSLPRSVGLEYFADPRARLLALLNNNNCISSGWELLDKWLAGGLNRQEMTIFTANSGVGKSITMSNVAHNFLMQGMDVVYITMELSENVVAKRFDSIFTSIAQNEIFNNIDRIDTIIKEMCANMGNLIIKRMPESTTCANHIRSYLKEYERMYGKAPDLLVVDYMDIMTSNHKISAENLFVKDKYIAEELRSIANDFDLVLVTASQQGRQAVQVKNDQLGQDAIAGGISKINTADNVISIIQTPQMKQAGEYMFKLLKTRSSNGVGQLLAFRWNPVSLRIMDVNAANNEIMVSRRRKEVDDYEKETDAQLSLTSKPTLVKPLVISTATDILDHFIV